MCAVDLVTARHPVEARKSAPSPGLRLALMVALAIGLHAISWRTSPPDMHEFLIPWYRHIVETGQIAAFAQPFSNYTPPYLYLLSAATLLEPLLAPFHVIKLLSVVCTLFLAYALGDLVRALDPGRSRMTGALVFLLPTAVINAAFLGQCDSLWAGACVLAVAALLRREAIRALVWCGVAIAFKAQAAFIAPFVIGSLIGLRVPLWHWTIPALVYAGAMLPAWALGWPAMDLATVYVRQAGHFSFPGNLANPWLWIGAENLLPRDGRPFYAVGYAAALTAATMIAWLAARSVGRKQAMISLALLSALALPWLLPKMHERYFFLADVLAFALALGIRDPRTRAIAVGVQCVSLSALFSYVTNWPVPAMAGAVVAAFVMIELYRQSIGAASGPDAIGREPLVRGPAVVGDSARVVG